MAHKLIEIRDPVECRILGRVNRFVVNVIVGSEEKRAFINNTGRLREYLVSGRTGYCIKRTRSGSTEYRLFSVAEDGLAALIDTGMQAEAFEKALVEGLLPWLWGCRVLRRNPRLGDSTLDYLLDCLGEPVYVELKSAVLRGRGYYAMYPDCPTHRGRRQISTLIDHARSGGHALIVFIAALPRVRAFRPYARGDPQIPRLLRDAAESGVIIKAVSMYYHPAKRAVYLSNPDLKVSLD